MKEKEPKKRVTLSSVLHKLKIIIKLDPHLKIIPEQVAADNSFALSICFDLCILFNREFVAFSGNI